MHALSCRSQSRLCLQCQILFLVQDEKEAGDRHVLWLSEKLEAVTGRAERLEESLAQAEHELAKTQEQASTVYTRGR
jgi:hypothetical protein